MRSRFLAWAGGLLVPIVGAYADVNLEWRVESENVPVGQIARVGLYAVADNPDGENVSTIDVLLDWDESFLRLIGVDDNGPYDWLVSGFHDDSLWDGLNDTFDDGDAYYRAWRNLNEVPAATPEGLLVTTFEFEALSPTDNTELTITEQFGVYSETLVLSGDVGGLDITGTLGSVALNVEPGGQVGDLDGDGDVDLADFTIFVRCFGATADNLPGGCSPEEFAGSDMDGDGEVTLADFTIFVSNFTG